MGLLSATHDPKGPAERNPYHLRVIPNPKSFVGKRIGLKSNAPPSEHA